MSEVEIIKCPICESNKFHRDQELYVCDSCGVSYRDGSQYQYYELKKLIETQLSNQEETTKGKLRQLLLREIEKEKDDFSDDDIIKWCDELLKLDPDDIVANYFKKFCKRGNHSKQSEYIEFIKSLSDKSIAEYDEQLIVTFMVGHVDKDTKETIFELLQNRGILDKYNDLLDKSYKNYEKQHALYGNIERKVFICHSSQNDKAVFDILIALEKEYGFNSCWISERNIKHTGGDTVIYRENIKIAIEKCEYFLVVTSKDSMCSDAVKWEMKYAAEKNRQRIEYILDENGKGVGRDNDFKRYFDGLEWIDGSGKTKYNEIINRIARLEEINKNKNSNNQQQKIDDKFKRQKEESTKQLKETEKKQNVSDNTKSKTLKKEFSEYDLKEFKINENNQLVQYVGNLANVIVPKGVVSIADHAFQNCSSIKSVVISDTIIEIGAYSFENCENLKSITIPKSLKKVGQDAFKNCKSLNYNEFANCRYLGNEKNPYYLLVDVSDNQVAKIKMHNNVCVVMCGAFRACKKIEILSISNCSENISYYFKGCNILQTQQSKKLSNDSVKINVNTSIWEKTLEILNSPKNKREEIFNFPLTLQTIIFEKGKINISSDMFKENNTISSIIVYSSDIEIQQNAFQNCTLLKNLTLSTLKHHLGYYFGASKYYENPAFIPKSLEKITILNCSKLPDNAFYGCKNLKEIYLEGKAKLDEKCIAIMEGCTNLQRLTLPNLNRKLCYYFGGDCENNKIPHSLNFIEILSGKKVPNYAFYNASGLNKIILPEKMKIIGNHSFDGCSRLYDVALKNYGKLKKIGKKAFQNTYCHTPEIEHKRISKIVISIKNFFSSMINVVWKIMKKFFSSIANLLKKIKKLFNVNCLTIISLILFVILVLSICLSPCIPIFYQFWNNLLFSCVSFLDINSSIIDVISGIFIALILLFTIIFAIITLYKLYWGDNGIAFPIVYFTLLTILLAPSIVTYAIPNSLVEQHAVTQNYSLQFKEINDGYQLKTIKLNMFGGEIDVVIPSEYNHKPITSIDSSLEIADMFNNHSINLSFAENCMITNIENYTFKDCKSLVNVTLPDSIIDIGDFAFSGCSSLTKINIPENVISIGNCAFENCTKLQSVYFEGKSKLENIGSYAFFKCDSLTNITIPKNVTSIGYCAFWGRSLTIYCESKVIPNGWSESWNLDGGGGSPRPVYWGINDKNIFTIDGIIYILENNSAIVSRFIETTSKVIIPSYIQIEEQTYNVTSIGDYAFSNCHSIQTISIPNTINTIGYDVFYNCDSIKYAHYSNGLYLGNDDNPYLVLVESSQNVETIKIHENSRFILNNAFQSRHLNTITIPRSIKSIGKSAFNGCKHLQNVNFEDESELESIGDDIFVGCTSLKSLTLPFIDIYLGHYFGASSYNYNSIYIPESLKSVNILGGTIIPNNAFYGCNFLTSITIPSSVVSIGEQAFSGCTSLESLTLPFIDTNLGYCFGTTKYQNNSTYVPKSLKTIIILGGTSIPDYAFYSCYYLTSITIPNSVTSVGNDAFYGCSSLTIYCESSSKPDNWDNGWSNGCKEVVWGYNG